MNKLSHFLICCSGISPKLLRKSPTEHNKYIGLGASILFTGVFATIAAGYALSLITNNIWVMMGIAIIWGLMIFNLDRLIMSSIHNTGRLKTDIIAILPRLLLAVFISFVIATPLELRLFESEIEDELQLMYKAAYNNNRNQLNLQYDSMETKVNKEIKDLKREIIAKENQRNLFMEMAQAEADGTGGSGKKNLGPIYLLKNENLKKVDEELKDLRLRNNSLIHLKRSEMKTLLVEKEQAIDHILKPQATGIAARMIALDQLSSKNSVVLWIKVFITLLFILIESTPIMLKLMIRKGPYDVITASIEKRITARYQKA